MRNLNAPFPRLLVLILIASMVLTACAVPAAPPAAPAEPAEAQPAESVADEPITLTLWGGFPEMEPFYKHVAEAYKQDHPNVDVEITTQPLREFEQKLSATIPSDTASDLIEISMYSNQKFIEAGLIPELPADVQEFTDTEGRYSEFMHQNNTYDGKEYGLPLFMGRTALFWNKDMFEEAGLPGPPETMEQMYDYAKQLAQYDDSGNLTRSGHSLRLSGQGSGVGEKWWFVLYPLGGSILEEVDGKYRAGYNNDAGRAALQYYIDAVHKDNWDDHAIKHDAEAFELEQTAMFFRESWVIGDIAKKNPDLNYGTAPVPAGERWGRITNPVNIYVTRSAENADVAWDFAQYMQQPEHLLWLLENVGWLPTRQDVDYSPVTDKVPQFEAFTMSDPDYGEFGYFVIAPFDEVLTKVAERLVSAYLDESLVDNPEGIAQVIEDAANETNAVLERSDMYAGE
ncbi:MAG: extracellular solute-binding protein [Chloroflexota bacterium]|nr:extracellular solute-binding protein [Chloroflexota bacterium]